MKLISLKINARGARGWQSETLKFGEDLTQLFGPNGCGKTPMIQSIAFALGHSTTFRDDINDNCESVTLVLSFDGTNHATLVREISQEFHIDFEAADGTKKSFYNELEFAHFFFEQMDWENTRLTTVGNKPTYGYMTMLLPLFYLDQDNGYSDQYYSPVRYVKDQYTEMCRFAIGVPPKHPFDRKRHLFLARQNLDAVDKQIVQSENFLENLYNQSSGAQVSSEEISREIDDANERLEALRNSTGIGQRASEAVLEVINSKITQKAQIEKEISDFRNRVESYSTIASEIEAEISTLSLNESARRAFDAFDEICVQPTCGLFMASSKSYGKHLLYLRDQLKDLSAQSEHNANQIADLERHCNELAIEIGNAREEIDKLEEGSYAEQIALATRELITRVFDLEKRKQIAITIEEEKRRFYQLNSTRDDLQNKLASLGVTRDSADLNYLRFRQNFKANILAWMNILNTKNVSRDISVNSDLKVLFGTEKLTVHKGSTLLRLVLAIRAAFFQSALEVNPSGLNFLIFDTPRQQDIETTDFSNFIVKLKELCAQSNAQIIFSTTEYRYKPLKDDIEWVPKFKGSEQNMFLEQLT